MTDVIRDERIGGALWGALAGDALGVPVEFQSREKVRRNAVTGMRGFGTHNQPAGTWSDDSSLLLCTVESLAAHGFDAADLGERFVRWKTEGHWTPHGIVFDIGVATSGAIARLEAGTLPEEAGGDDEYSNGNGSLMRILPIALWFHGVTSDELASYARRASSLTHRHRRSQLACALYCLLVSELIGGAAPEDALQTSLNTFDRLHEQPPFAAEMRHFQLLHAGDLVSLPENDIRSSGYVLDTLMASIWCLLTSSSFEEAVLKAVNLGGDADTTGTVTGGLAGGRYGVKSIPSDWITGLVRHDDVATLFARFRSRLPHPALAAP